MEAGENDKMVFEKLRTLIMDQFAVDEDAVTMETSFVDDLGANSLDIVELTMAIEEAFDLPELEEDELKDLVTVGDVARSIAQKIGD